MAQTDFVIIGGGWRSQFFLRAARELHHKLNVAGMLVRNAEKGAAFEKECGVRTYRTMEELLTATKPAFAVVSVSKSSVVDVLADLTTRKIPVLTETPPAGDFDALDRVNELTKQGGRIQVAEQYIFQPMHVARLAVARSGLLGTVSQAQISFNQGYHNISLIRHYLGVKAEPLKITARKFESPVFKGPDRAGPPREEKIVNASQTIAWLEWDKKLGVFDFAGDQHRSYIRSYRVLVRGEKGEINQTRVRYLKDFKTGITFDLLRKDAGDDDNLEGFHNNGIVGNDRWWYHNPAINTRLADDEIAVATCLLKMIAYAGGGADFYTLAEASWDQYLALKIDESANTQSPLDIIPPDWAKW